ncbi:MAG: UDP-glucose/GDP-mannose dehydrogenase family protein [Chloroflexi bacterium]|nr:UDP-glucose/GDP-mannose dehydrogenase family protein [Chloroflexota bacterium]
MSVITQGSPNGAATSASDEAPSAASVIGLGKLGAPMAAAVAAKGVCVVGVDVDLNKVRAMNDGQAPVFEPGLQELLATVDDRLTATDDVEAAVAASDVTFIVVLTPSEPDGGFSLRYVLPACEAIGRALRKKRTFHLVVLTSTVMPGSTGGPVREALERASGKRCGEHFGLCYSPEFIALGSVIRDFLNPDFVLIGESDPHAGDLLEGFYRRVYENDPPMARMNFVNAELAKLALNTFVTTKITYANMLARICERLPDADVDVVTSAVGLDSRVGRKYLKGTTAYGGPCFPRDNLALIALGRGLGAPALLAEATDRSNRGEIARLAELVKHKLPPMGTVGILGLAYKPNTDVIEASPGVLLAQTLAAEGCRVVAYDPAAMAGARRVLGDPIDLAPSLDACVRRADVLVITTPWEAFRALDPRAVARHSAPRVIIDCWRILDRQHFASVAKYVPLGVGAMALDAEDIRATA